MSDISYILLWWGAFLGIGILTLPLTASLFSVFFDRGYIFSKALGIALVSYLVFIVGITHMLPFSPFSIFVALLFLAGINLAIARKQNLKSIIQSSYKFWIGEEVLFLAAFSFWAYIRGHEPSIHGLEKFMDFGFVNTILRSTYFPPRDMWFPPYAINYYYFGHLVTAALIKFTAIPSQVGFNLMLATIFGLAFVSTFSIGINLTARIIFQKRLLIRGILASLLLTLAGNLHPIYTFFTQYKTDNPVPPWSLAFSPKTYPNLYWYANATRFIPFTIHEFPIYSFVVADLHGHVLDIPFVLTVIALLFALYKTEKESYLWYGVYAFFLSVMYMTNAWDGAIYLLAASLVLLVKFGSILNIQKKSKKRFAYTVHHFGEFFVTYIKRVGFLVASFIVFTFPFSVFFQTGSLVHGIGVLCAPKFLTNLGHLGPFLFEANHCQRSPLWQLAILYGFFYICVLFFIGYLLRKKEFAKNNTETFILILILLSTILILAPEFVYLKDIYPQHYRANTMFKLVYQAFMILSICCAYIITKLLRTKLKFIFGPLVILMFIPLFIFPYFAVSSYYGFPPNTPYPCNSILPPCTLRIMQTYVAADIANYKGLDGTKYLKASSPEDYDTIQWLNKNVKGQPVILEAQGDSYTDYERISSYTGLPTILGWTVHEWLWRGTYDIPAPRITEVQTIYTTSDATTAKQLLRKYNVKYVYVGDLERQKYPTLSEDKFKLLGRIVFQEENSRLYKLN